MKQQYKLPEPYQGTLYLDYIECINYSMVHSLIPILLEARIGNDSDMPIEDIWVCISGEYLKESRCVIGEIRGKSSSVLPDLSIQVDPKQLYKQTERVHSEVVVELGKGEEVLERYECPISLLPVDYWGGIDIYPYLIATFVTPNHPLISRVLLRAGEFLDKWTSSSSLDGYQSGEPTRVRFQVAAIYEALRAENIIYANPPSSFERLGQRVRLADKVLGEKLATCLDLPSSMPPVSRQWG